METLDKRLTGIEGKSAGAFQSMSPISLTSFGQKLLEDSVMKEYIDSNSEKFENSIISLCKNKTSYDIQNCSFNFFDSLAFPSEIENKLKEFAFGQGVEMNVFRRVGGIYLRDILLNKLNLNLEDTESSNKEIL